MKEQFIPYELALKLKELGLNLDYILQYYNPEYGSKSTLYSPNRITCSRFIPAPLWQQAFDFIREKYNKNAILFSDGFQWTFDLRWIDEDDIMQYPSTQFPKKEVGREMFDTYYEAREKALEKLIEICSKQQ